MRKTTVAVVGLILFMACLGWSQANVAESEESAHLYVSANGSDSNLGAQPANSLATISEAVSVALANRQRGIGTTITVAPGTYRESITLTGGSGSAPITLQAATPGTVTVSGADVWKGWSRYSGNSSIYTHNWPYTWGLCPALTAGPYEQAIVRRKELIFVNGTMLTEVLSLQDMRQGTFFVNESNHTVYIWPPSGTNIGSATVEVGVRPSLFSAHRESNVVLRNMIFEYAPGCRQIDAAVTIDGGNVLVEGDQFNWNGDTGLSLSGSDMTIESSEANYNGMTGFQAQGLLGSHWTDDEADYNNWRGAQGAYYEWDDAGAKLFSIHTATVNGFKAFYNLGKGVHFDTDNLNLTIDSLVAADNLASGLQIEASLGPVSVSNSALCSNNRGMLRYDGGVNEVDSSHITLSDDTFYNNGTSQILVTGSNGGRPVRNYQTGQTTQVYDQNLDLSSDVVVAQGSNQRVFQDSYLTREWPRFVNSLSSNRNTWWNSSDSSDFVTPGSSGRDLTQWRSATKQDSNSVWRAPSVNPSESCSVTPDPDYWVIVNEPSQSVSPGRSTTFTIQAVPVAFGGTISLAADTSQIPHASARWSSGSIGSSGSSTVTVTTSSSTRAGTYPLTLIGTSESLTRTVTVSVVVQ